MNFVNQEILHYMDKYNIIFTSPDHKTLLWNGSSFDDLESDDREGLFFSGKSVKEDELASSLIKCKTAATKLFPGETDLKIKQVKIDVA